MLDSILGTQLTLSVFLACTAASLLLGVGVALVSTFRSRSTPGFAVTLAILPAVVQLVIMLVNGNLGTGVAIAGAFGLDTTTRANIMSAVYTAQAAVNTTRTIVQAVK